MSTVRNNTSLDRILKQAQKLQGQLGRLESDMKAKVVEASAGDGKVTAVVNGNRELIALNIDPSVLKSDNPELLENLVISAVNTALNNVREMVNHEMNKATGGFSIPGLM
ncbi:MAG: YbaB/EbfC family nucleoid-associated protein [Proteobacteria bacterium]|jgi:DNA-binding YbaB/EbfC family protein|nr:YbaB/EbfC family nucleoid-associated protein [Pseudomonadota bacterium]